MKKMLIGLLFAIAVCSLPALAQKNEVGLVMGATLTPNKKLSPGVSLVGPNGNLLPDRELNFDASLAMGIEYDRLFVSAGRVAIYAGVDFLASPNDVHLSQNTQNAPKSYAYVFLTPHIRAKFNPQGMLSPWLEFGGGYARFLSATPTSTTSFSKGRNTGTFVFGGGMDTRTLFRVVRIPIGFRLEVRDFYSGLPNYGVNVDGGMQHNVALTGGLLIRF